MCIRDSINHVLLANNRRASVCDCCPTFVRPSSNRAFEISRCYNIEAPTVQAYAPCEVSPWLLRKPNWGLEVASRSKKSFYPTKLNPLFRSDLEKYVEKHTVVYNDRSKTESEVGSAFLIEGASNSWTLTKLQAYTPPNCTRCGRLYVSGNTEVRNFTG